MEKFIVMFGGSFNPPTNAHFRLATALQDTYNNVSKVVFMPVGDNYNYKGKENAPGKYRKMMLESVCINYQGLEVSEIELNATKTLTTYETLSQLEKEYSRYKVAFLIGSDNLKDIDNWANAKELIENYKIWVMPRNGDIIEDIIKRVNIITEENKENIVEMPNEIQMNLSSTFVREQIRKRRSLDFLLPRPVINIIKKYRLYDYFKEN